MSYEQNKGGSLSLPSEIIPIADWNLLIQAIMTGSLNELYLRLTIASFVDPTTATVQDLAIANNVAVAAGKIDQAIQVTKKEEATASSLNMLVQTSTYRFTLEEIVLWNSKVDELNFTSQMHLHN